MNKKKQLTVLGSTGSIGTQALDVIRQHPDKFEVYALTANVNVDKLAAQAREFLPDSVVIADETKYEALKDSLAGLPVKVYAGSDAVAQVAGSHEADMVLVALVGFSGLAPTMAAIEAGRAVALANKETLVVAGELVTEAALRHNAPIIPVDSEHSAIFQCLAGEPYSKVERILLTASGGPFRRSTPEELRGVTPEQALRHPRWDMGAKITIDSATMMNKGFEVIEARWLFDVKPEQIEVVVHPESIVHSAVQFEDGAVKAQLGVPDMRVPIQYAFTYPARIPLQSERLDFFALGTLHFERPDVERFPCLAIAYEALHRGGNMPCVVNAANEVLNLAFRQGRVGFCDISTTIRKVMEQAPFELHPTLDDYFAIDREVRCLTETYL